MDAARKMAVHAAGASGDWAYQVAMSAGMAATRPSVRMVGMVRKDLGRSGEEGPSPAEEAAVRSSGGIRRRCGMKLEPAAVKGSSAGCGGCSGCGQRASGDAPAPLLPRRLLLLLLPCAAAAGGAPALKLAAIAGLCLWRRSSLQRNSMRF